MAKASQFKAYDLRRKSLHTIVSPPVKLQQPRLDRGEWAQASKTKAASASKSGKVSKKHGRFSKKKGEKKPPQTAMDVLSCAGDSEIECLHCGKLGDDPSVRSLVVL